MSCETDMKYMHCALRLAQKAAAAGEVPVGCVIVWDGNIVGRGYNRRESKKCALEHAEIMAIRSACRRLGGWRLWKAEMFVTLEPCPMCAGAILNSRIRRVCFGATDANGGAMGGAFDLFSMKVGFSPEVVGGLLAEECAAIIKKFFAKLREKNQA